jgi:putative DNA primase/helicase
MTSDSNQPIFNPEQDATGIFEKLGGMLREHTAKKANAEAKDANVNANLGESSEGDEDVIRLIRKDRKGSALWQGQWEGLGLEDSSHSGADFALMQRLAFYTGKNPAQMDDLFRRSALYREAKWDSPRPGGTYGSLTIDAAIAATTDVYSRRGRAPLPRAEAGTVMASGSSGSGAATAPAMDPQPAAGDIPDLLSFAHTDMGHAGRVRALYGERMRYSADEKSWLVWSGTQWGRLEGLAQELAKATATETTRQALASGNKPAIKNAYDFQNKSRISNALALLASELNVASNDFDRQANLLNCRNGTLNLETGTLQPHNREDLLTKRVDVDYDPDAKCPQFMAFLAHIMGHTPDASEGDIAQAAEKIDYLQLALGYSITGDTGEKAVFIAHGPNNTGKTTLLGIVRQLLGSYATPIKLEVVLSNDRSNSAEAALANLRGARFAQSSETEEGQKMSAAMLKRVSQGPGGMITACRKYENPISFPETHKLWIDANHQPELSASDDAAWIRLRLVPFLVHIPKENRDLDLHKRLLAEEGSGILSWLAVGARRWYANGLPTSRIVDEATGHWREDVNRVKVFIDETCSAQVNASVPNKNLYGAYRTWSEDNGERFLSNRKFSAQLKSLGFENKHTNDGSDWLGLRFRLPS